MIYSVTEIVQLVQKGCQPPFRPVINTEEWISLQDLMDDCLEEDPSSRPHCSKIQNKCKKINRYELTYYLEPYENNLLNPDILRVELFPKSIIFTSFESLFSTEESRQIYWIIY